MMISQCQHKIFQFLDTGVAREVYPKKVCLKSFYLEVSEMTFSNGSFIGRQVDFSSFYYIRILCKLLPVTMFAVRHYKDDGGNIASKNKHQ